MTPIEVTCPYCHQPPLQRCLNTNGMRTITPHQARVRAAGTAGLAVIAGAGVCQCPGVAGVHIQGVAGCG